MNKYVFLLNLICCVSFNSIQAQQSANLTENLTRFQEAITLYNKSQYNAASNQFKKLINTGVDGLLESDCHYYIANCAIKLNKVGAEQMISDFVIVFADIFDE